MNRYWVRFKLFGTDDYGTLLFPPNRILGYWCSGYGVDFCVLCCVIECESIDEIPRIVNMNFVGAPDENVDIDFIDKKPDNWVPSGDRFPLANWMETLRKDSNYVSVNDNAG